MNQTTPGTEAGFNLDLDNLEALARAAMPGPWFANDWSNDFGDNKTTVEAREPEVLHPGQSSIWPGGIRCRRVADTEEADSPIENAAFIAAANPAVILKLIALARRDAPDTTAQPDTTASASIDTPEFRELVYNCDSSQQGTGYLGAIEALITYIDRRASLAPVSAQQGAAVNIEVAYDIKDAAGPGTQVVQAKSVVRNPDGSYTVFIDAPDLAAKAPAAQAVDAVDELIKAADAVVERWHSRDWKQPHTAEFIARLSAALGTVKFSPEAMTSEQQPADEQIDRIARAYFSEEYDQQKVKEAIRDAFKLIEAAHAQQPAAPAEPEGWRAFIENCSRCGSGIVNGNRLSMLAKDLLATAPAPAGEDAKDVEFCQPELPNPEIPAYGEAAALFTTEQVKLAQVDGMIAALERRRNSLPLQYAERFDLAVEIDKLRTKRAAMSAHQAKKTEGAA